MTADSPEGLEYARRKPLAAAHAASPGHSTDTSSDGWTSPSSSGSEFECRRSRGTETVTLDASGTMIKVAVSTLEKLPDTMLGRLVSKEWSGDACNAPIFLDIEPEHLREMIYYYRYGQLSPGADAAVLRPIFDAYGLPPLITAGTPREAFGDIWTRLPSSSASCAGSTGASSPATTCHRPPLGSRGPPALCTPESWASCTPGPHCVGLGPQPVPQPVCTSSS